MLTHRGRIAMVGAAMSLTLLAACDPAKVDATGTTTPPPTTPQPTETIDSVPTAPPVADPLNARHFEYKPCDSLTADQRRALGITSAEPVNITRDGEECQFVRRPGDTILLVFASNVANGLSSRYAEHSSGTWVQWEPTELDGYPALVFGTSEPNECNFAVSLTDELYFWASVTDLDARCPQGRTAAAAVLTTLKAAS